MENQQFGSRWDKVLFAMSTCYYLHHLRKEANWKFANHPGVSSLLVVTKNSSNRYSGFACEIMRNSKFYQGSVELNHAVGQQISSHKMTVFATSAKHVPFAGTLSLRYGHKKSPKENCLDWEETLLSTYVKQLNTHPKVWSESRINLSAKMHF